MEHLFIVMWKRYAGDWQPESTGAFSDRRVAENYAEVKRLQEPGRKFAILEGAILTEETPEEAEARLGAF